MNTNNDAARHFQREMLDSVEEFKRDLGYYPTRFMQMVGQYGAVGAGKRLLAGEQYSEGFTKLWEHGRLGKSLEAFALLPWYAPLFNVEERDNARRRLSATAST